MTRQNYMDFGGAGEFGDPPESVSENLNDIERVIAQRREANRRTAEKNDTERYLVIVFANRAAREQVLKTIGLPADERYILAEAVELRVRDGKSAAEALLLTGRDIKAAPVEHSGAGG